MSRRLILALCATVMSETAWAQPAPATQEPGEQTVAAPLAQIGDEKQLVQTLSAITQDPAIPVDDPKTRALAQALMVEGVKQLQAKTYDQALANFLEAYAKFPSPKILLNIASTLRDMGRLADAANTYQRYLADPATGAERVAEVKELLLRLDEQLTILTVRVFPSGSDVSIDAGPFIPVGTSLLTRVRPGIHLVRVRKSGSANEVSVNGFEGENKEVSATVKMEVPDTPETGSGVANAGAGNPGGGAAGNPGGGAAGNPGGGAAGNPGGGAAGNPALNPKLVAAPPEHVEGWLITGTQYSSGDGGTPNERHVRAGYSGPEVAAIVPHYEISDGGDAIVPGDESEAMSSGVIAALRIDGEGRGAAGAIGLVIARGHLEAELMFLKSDSTGGYLGVRYRLLTGWVRPYLGLGMPGFAYKETNAMNETSTKLGVGVRGAVGVELRINGHFSVQGDVGYEHFFVDQDTTGIDANVFVPTVGVIGRL